MQDGEWKNRIDGEKAVPERKKEENNGKRGEKDNCNEECRRRRRRIGMTERWEMLGLERVEWVQMRKTQNDTALIL